MWTCPVCSRAFKRKNQSHFCTPVNTVEEYIARFSPSEQERLHELRRIIKHTAPEAEETIRWDMPTFMQNGNIAHFAVHKNHIGLYVGSTAVLAFENELEHLTFAKGTIHLPKEQPLPHDVIKKIVRFNIERNANK